MHLLANTLLQGGKYKIVSFISAGGFGCTYEGVHTMLDTRVAIKEFFPKMFCNRDDCTSHVFVATQSNRELVDKLCKKFIDEAKAIFKMNHSNIVKVHDIFEENGTAYYVMDYIDGKSLGDIVRQRGALPEAEAVNYIRQVAGALKYVHSLNRLHLDIKPGNVMVDANRHATLIDFGASKYYDVESGENTSTLMGVNTKGYAPVEQSTQSFTKFSPATDIYALGATLYKLLTGTTPPDANLLMAKEEILAPMPTNISIATRNAVLKAMTLIRAERPQSIAELLYLLDGKTSVNGEATLYDSSNDALPPRELYTEHIRQKAMEQYLAEKRAKAEKVAIEAEIQRLRKEDEKKAKLAKEQEEAERLKREVIKIFQIRTEDEAKIFTLKGIEFKMIKVEGGTFDMEETISSGFLNLFSKDIVRQTTVSDYYIGETEVTQALWKAVMGNNPSRFKGDNLPVENVSWNDCQKFISKLNSMTGQNFRLPTEAEWEFAARGGNKSKGYMYSGSNILDDVAWYYDNSDGETHPVKTKTANELGIYDMSGNVWEWCQDRYGDYSSSSQTNPTGPAEGSYRVFRGCSWGSQACYCRSSNRGYNAPGDSGSGLGLRLAF